MAHYFVNHHVSRSDAPDGVGRYWRASESYSGWGVPGDTYAGVAASGVATNARFRFQVNLHLLAGLLGDDPVTRQPPGSTLVAPIPYTARHRERPTSANESTTISVQPWEALAPFGLVEVPIGSGLAGFLDDPLGTGRRLGLGLPVMHAEATVSQTWIRSGTNPFHGGFDFSVDAAPAAQRPLFDACAAADGEVMMLINTSGHQGGVVLLHQAGGGREFATLYQHLQPSSITLAVGDRVVRGQRLGRVRKWHADSSRTHCHVNVVVRGPAGVSGLAPASRPWFAIDPFGVYDEHDRTSTGDYNYIPRPRGGAGYPIHGAERTIHWRGNPPIEAFSGELVTPFSPVRQLQMRAYRTAGSNASPGEMAQMLVWLEGDDRRYHLRLGAELDRGIEDEMCALLRDAYAFGKRVRLGYRFRSGRPEVSAAWVR